MLTNISKASTAFLINKRAVSEEKQKIYQYGFEVLYSTAFGLGTILCLGIIGQALPETLIFLTYFIIIRLFAGGYHAPNYAGCFLITNAAYLAERMLAEYLPEKPSVLWILFLCNIVYIWLEAPVQTPHRRLSAKRLRVNRVRTHISLILSVIAMFFYQRFGLFWVMSEALSALMIVSVLIILTKIKRRK